MNTLLPKKNNYFTLKPSAHSQHQLLLILYPSERFINNILLLLYVPCLCMHIFEMLWNHRAGLETNHLSFDRKASAKIEVMCNNENAYWVVFLAMLGAWCSGRWCLTVQLSDRERKIWYRHLRNPQRMNLTKCGDPVASPSGQSSLWANTYTFFNCTLRLKVSLNRRNDDSDAHIASIVLKYRNSKKKWHSISCMSALIEQRR